MDYSIEPYLKQLNIPAYLTGLERVNYMIASHLSQFAFSSLNVMLGRDLPLDIDSIVERIVHKNQGGYCFEHNKLLYAALAFLGYEVRPILARVVLDGNEYSRRSHRATLLTHNSQHYLVDAGFGLGTPREALLLQSQNYLWDQVQARLLTQEGQDFRFEQCESDQWQTMYRFDLSEATEDDCDASHFYTHKFPDSLFINNLIVSKIHPQRRVLIRRLELIEYDDQIGSETQTPITSAQQLHHVITQLMELNFTEQEVRSIFDHQQQRALAAK